MHSCETTHPCSKPTRLPRGTLFVPAKMNTIVPPNYAGAGPMSHEVVVFREHAHWVRPAVALGWLLLLHSSAVAITSSHSTPASQLHVGGRGLAPTVTTSKANPPVLSALDVPPPAAGVCEQRSFRVRVDLRGWRMAIAISCEQSRPARLFPPCLFGWRASWPAFLHHSLQVLFCTWLI